jgi:hypothetical protein
MQAPESYNLTQVMEQIKAGGGHLATNATTSTI